MRRFWNKWGRTILFSLGGAGIGLVYYRFFGCTSGCAITSSPLLTTVYMGLLGWLVAGVTEKQKEV